MTKRINLKQFQKDIAKVQEKIDLAKKCQENLDCLGAERAQKQAEELLERLKAKYIEEKVTFT